MKISQFATPLICLPFNFCHVQMKYPHPRGDPEDLATGPSDYNLASPLKSASLCNGKPPGSVTAVYNAGDTIKVRFHGSARHGGGLCQFALSYDDQKFVVIQEIIGGCPNEAYEWPVTLPSNLQSCDRCTFAWTWVNAIGNREYYMNCADIAIHGSDTGGHISGHDLYIANLPGYPEYTPPISDAGPEESQTKKYSVAFN